MTARDRGPRRGRIAGGLAAVLFLSLGLGPLGGVAAADSREEAAQHFERGEQLYRQGSYREAIEEFRAAYAAERAAAPLYNLARCHESLGEVVAALELYEQYLQQLAPGAADRETVERRIANLRQRPVQVLVSSVPAGATVHEGSEQNAMAGRTPFVLRLAPGPHVLLFTKSGYRRTTRTLQLEVGEDLTVEVTLRPTTEPADDGGPASRGRGGDTPIPEARRTPIPSGAHLRMALHAGFFRWLAINFAWGGHLGLRVDHFYANLFVAAMRYGDTDPSQLGSAMQIEGGWVFPGNGIEAIPFLSIGSVIDIYDPNRLAGQPMTSLTLGLGGQVEYRLFSFLLLSGAARVIMATQYFPAHFFSLFSVQMVAEF